MRPSLLKYSADSFNDGASRRRSFFKQRWQKMTSYVRDLSLRAGTAGKQQTNEWKSLCGDTMTDKRISEEILSNFQRVISRGSLCVTFRPIRLITFTYSRTSGYLHGRDFVLHLINLVWKVNRFLWAVVVSVDCVYHIRLKLRKIKSSFGYRALPYVRCKELEYGHLIFSPYF